MNDAQQTICLCMIVKNENHVITRCLASVRPLIDTWVIVDTGSTDGTQQTILTYFSDLPGQLFERPWVDFAHNRSESLALARRRADYVLVIDADELLQLDPGFRLPVLDADSYLFPMRSGGLSYYKTQLVRDALDWRFVGVIHEYIVSEQAVTHKLVQGLQTLRITDGARSRDPLTYRRDALLLEDALLQDPGNTRHMFYLAQSYADAQEPLLAIDRYQKRFAMGGWLEEAWFSLYRIASTKEQMNLPWPAVMTAYLAAYSYNPSRAEPLYRIGLHYQGEQNYPLAHLFLAQAIEIPYPKNDLLYVEQQVYEVLLPLEYSVACFYIGRHREAIETNNRMLSAPGVTPELADRLIRNRDFSLEARYPKRDPGSIKTGKIIVCIALEPEAWPSPACLESLRIQDYADFQIVLIQKGHSSSDGLAPDLETRILLKQPEEPLTWAGSLKLATEDAHPDDIVFLMDPTDQLFDAGSLTHLAAHFQSYDCDLTYGQFNRPDGTRGNAIPLASPDDLETPTWDNRPLIPLAFCCGLLSESDLPDSATPFTLLQQAGFIRIRFNDQILLVHNLES